MIDDEPTAMQPPCPLYNILRNSKKTVPRSPVFHMFVPTPITTPEGGREAQKSLKRGV